MPPPTGLAVSRSGSATKIPSPTSADRPTDLGSSSKRIQDPDIVRLASSVAWLLRSTNHGYYADDNPRPRE
ncbi:MAG TPA: hypothetical protein ENK31_09330 [Nannocystis exedens]|nr:hypothetical protein [Nannocystis exedens]